MIRGDLGAVTYDKLRTALNPLCTPAPGPNGERDTRSPAQRHADGFADLLDAYLGSGLAPGEGGVTPHLTLLAGAKDLAGRGTFVHNLHDPDPHGEPPTGQDYHDLFDAKWPFHLAWVGSVSKQVAQMLACDCDVTVVLLDGHRVPLDVGRTERLVTPQIRTALVVRDQGCIMPGCGRPAKWFQAHHIREWIDGGETKLTNLVLLCRRHHQLIHKGHWKVFIGEDGHPWFVPPEWVDKHRRPLPAHNRRGAGTGTAA